MISVVVPCFNEEAVMQKTYNRLKSTFASTASVVEIIFVNDGSRDRTGSIIASFQQTDRLRVVPVEFTRNFGHSAAVMAGVRASSGDMVAIIDADLQDPPELILPMIEKIREGFDIVYGKRVHRKAETFFKRITAWIFYRMLRFLTDVDIPSDTGDFRVITREVADVFKTQIHEQDPFLRGLVAWVGYRQYPFEYSRDARVDGETKYTLRRMIRFALTGILGFSNAPLYLGVYLSLISFVLAIASIVYLIYLKFYAFTVPGWVSTMVVISAFGAFQFLFFGITGAYIARINKQVTNRPIFIVRKPGT